MVKIWGYDYSNKRKHPGGMFTFQQMRADPVPRGKPKEVIMKLPKVYDIQRLVLARHLMYLRHPEVREGKALFPKEFETNFQKFRKLSIRLRPSGPMGGVNAHRIRKLRVKMQPQPNNILTEDNGQTTKRKWDLESMSFKNIVTDTRNEIQLKRKKRASHKMEKEDGKVEEDEEWQRRHWLRKLMRDLKSDRVNEILANHRMVTYDDARRQHPYTVYLEAAHYALKTHNWSVVAKCLCGMTENYRTLTYMRRRNGLYPSFLAIFWTLGFLTIANHYKNDVSKLEEFAKNVRTLLGGHPLYTVSHLAVWLIQKGFFMSAYQMVDEYSLDHISKKSRYRIPSYNKMENPKRDLAIFITDMIKAVYLYCDWKVSIESEDDADDSIGAPALRRDTLRRKGESALGAFEACYVKYKVIEGDAMCFIAPFIELVVEFRSVHRAREILEEVFNINDGNFFVEEFYSDFLEEHFSDSEQDLIQFVKQRTQRKFDLEEPNKREMNKKGRRRIKNLLEKSKKKHSDNGGDTVFKMKKIAKPAFSW